mgnify:CR=1 FL=1
MDTSSGAFRTFEDLEVYRSAREFRRAMYDLTHLTFSPIQIF